MKQCWPLLHIFKAMCKWQGCWQLFSAGAYTSRFSRRTLTCNNHALNSRGESVLSCCPSGEDLPSRAPLVDPTSCGPRPSSVLQSAIVGQERHNRIPMYVSETVCNTQRLSGFFYLEACGWIHRLWAKGTQAQCSASLIEIYFGTLSWVACRSFDNACRK